MITVVGRISGTAEGVIGEYSYRYVLLDADAVHLWPVPPDLTIATSHRRHPIAIDEVTCPLLPSM